ncbi:MAG: bifunctional diaminohydroxyphosphoribosylaminopyrimidine deaminase/5-amino-6-(5-phosphoribosylamino)uracil reductase RibD [Pyrinomonadaceae bacterium]|nr:bifunctional diaminohydroxyphosphoribosylaminopyrimidine deaminase/5-amino-6-(5-phosphoribosylamino)uracil reductase RibD [Pyrinomonadaceae bacterium]
MKERKLNTQAQLKSKTDNAEREHDARLMRLALDLSARGMGRVSPSPLVGCVIADDRGEVLGEGFYLYERLKHAEIFALEKAGARARGATAYVSLEPHAHYGRTAPCTDALIAAGVRRVVAPIEDPNPLVSGNGFRALHEAGIETIVGLLADEAARQNEKYICAMLKGRPFVHLKLATSLDGRIDFGARKENALDLAGGGEARWLTGSRARARVHKLRHEYDAILIGANTARVDDPLLTDRSNRARRRPLVRIVLDSKLSLSHESQLVKTVAEDKPLLIFVDESQVDLKKVGALRERGVEIELLPSGTKNLTQVLRNLYERTLHSVLVEGGAQVASAFLKQKLIDKVSFLIAPLIIGDEGATTAVKAVGSSMRLRDVSQAIHGEDVEVTGYPNFESQQAHVLVSG